MRYKSPAKVIANPNGNGYVVTHKEHGIICGYDGKPIVYPSRRTAQRKGVSPYKPTEST